MENAFAVPNHQCSFRAALVVAHFLGEIVTRSGWRRLGSWNQCPFSPDADSVTANRPRNGECWRATRPASLLVANQSIDLSSVGGCWIEWKEICSGLFTGGREMETQVFTFAASRFVPVAIGFFGLGTGYFIWGGRRSLAFPSQAQK
jgi:hypothetical protein